MTSWEERRNIRSAITMSVISIGLIVILYFVGIPFIGKVSSVISGLRGADNINSNDTTPPAPPKFNVFPDFTNQKTINLTGSSEAGATVTLNFDGQSKDNVADKNGQFTFSVDLSDGKNSFFASAKDTAGNVSKQTDTYSITLDSKPPDLTIIKPSDGTSFFGSAQRQITIQGTTEDQAQLTINDRIITVDDNGNFQYSTTLSEGQNTFDIKATDEAGNLTEKNLTLTFTP